MIRPFELRNLTWREVEQHVTEDMRRVHAAWLEHGPCTTRVLAARSGISLLTLRPRTTDLYQIGLVECVARHGTEGIYEYRSHAHAEQAEAWREERVSNRQKTRATLGKLPAFRTREELVRWAASVMGQEAKARRLRRHEAMNDCEQMELLSA